MWLIVACSGDVALPWLTLTFLFLILLLSQSPPTVSDEAFSSMENSELSPVVSPLLSQTFVRAFVSRVVSKRKSARLDLADGPSP